MLNSVTQHSQVLQIVVKCLGVLQSVEQYCEVLKNFAIHSCAVASTDGDHFPNFS